MTDGYGSTIRERDGRGRVDEIVKIAKPIVEISDRARLNLEKFFWSSREK